MQERQRSNDGNEPQRGTKGEKDGKTREVKVSRREEKG
jgi:hypothetical protein